MGGDEIRDRGLAKPGSQRTTIPYVFFCSLARGLSMAYRSLATGSKHATKQLEGGFLEPGQKLATQSNRLLIYGQIYMVGSNAAVINLFVSLDNCHV